MVGDTIMSEIYYNQALVIDPNNNLINQKLGELYFKTKRTSQAKEKLKYYQTVIVKNIQF